MPSAPKAVASAGLIVGLTVGSLTVGSLSSSAHAMGTGGGGIPITTARTVDTEAVELQRIRASVRAKGRVLKTAAPLLVTAEVPGDVTDIDKRTRLGLPTWRVVVEMESGYKVAAFVHRRTGVIIDWTVLRVPADVEYTPPKKDANRPELDPAKPKPAPVPAIVEQAIESERQSAAPAAATPGAGNPAPAATSVADGDDGSSDDDSHDSSRHDSSDDSRDSSDHDSPDDDSRDDSRDDSHHDSRDDDSRDHGDRREMRDQSDDSHNDDSQKDSDDDPDDD